MAVVPGPVDHPYSYSFFLSSALRMRRKMTNEDESTDPRMTAAEREILKFLGDREANEAALEDRETPAVNQFAQHPAPANPAKQTNTVDVAGGRLIANIIRL